MRSTRLVGIGSLSKTAAEASNEVRKIKSYDRVDDIVAKVKNKIFEV